jgi:anaerobic selenocysteine-containing dehydrogenase
VLVGLCKSVIAADDAAVASGAARVLDEAFVREHTQGFEDFARYVRQTQWADIEQVSGLTRAHIELAAREYMKSKAVIIHYGMGLTQHRMGVQNVRLLCNFLMLRGNIGKPGAGPSPVRGHSNVQGQRTVGITEKPELAPLDKLARQFSFDPPRRKGMNLVEAFDAMVKGKVTAVLNLGGNLVRSVPDRTLTEPAWSRVRLTVSVATKLNRSHLVHGTVAYILPCLSRIEIDRQAGGEQAVSMEDSTGCMHGSHGVTEPSQSRRALRAFYRRRHRQGYAARPFDSGLGRLARRLPSCASRDRRDLSGDLSRFRSPHVDARRIPETPAGTRAQVADAERKGRIHGAHVARRGSRHGGARARRVAPDDVAFRQPVQHDHL